jgi:hypothetical protein
MGAILLNGVHVGTGSIVGAGAMCPEGMQIPPNSLVLGLPARRIRDTSADERDRVRRTVNAYLELQEEHRAGRVRERRGDANRERGRIDVEIAARCRSMAQARYGPVSRWSQVCTSFANRHGLPEVSLFMTDSPSAFSTAVTNNSTCKSFPTWFTDPHAAAPRCDRLLPSVVCSSPIYQRGDRMQP